MMKNKLFLFALLGFLLIALPGMVNAKAATSIDTTPATTTVKAGEQVAWTVTATYDDATTEDVSAFATFNIPTSAGGSLLSNVYTTEIPGTYTIPVTVGNFSDAVTLTVVHGDPVSLELTASTSELTAGSDAATFTATLRDTVGNEWDATGQLTLSTDDPNATISGTAFASTHAGTWTINGTVGTLQASKQITVIPDTATTISISGDDTIILSPNGSIDLSAVVKDQFGNIVDETITWAVSNDTVTIDVNGMVRAQKTGEVTVTASGNGDVLASKIIRVQADSTNTNTASPTNESMDENTNTDESADVMEEESDEETCEQVQPWILIVIFAVYALILYAYYMLIRKEDDKSWWIFPVLLTVIGVIVWNKYLCPDTIAWFPWVMLAIGLALTGYGRGAMRTSKGQHTDTQNPQEPQNPMF